MKIYREINMKILKNRLMIRNNWSINEISDLYNTPLLQLLSKSHIMHAAFHNIEILEVCSLISFKTGGCTEDCHYCPQSARYKTHVKPSFLSYDEMMEKAKEAIERGASRICIGSAWRTPKEGKAFDTLLKAISDIAKLNVEVCCTLGMLTESQAKKLKEAGVFAYNHNLDSSKRFYKTIITTRSYEERLTTLNIVEKTGLSLCTGAILGMGETRDDRIAWIHTLATRNTHPDSIPLNFLIRAPGTPLGKAPKLPLEEMLRTIASVRITMPKATIRLAAGRLERNSEEMMLCIMTGVNSLFLGPTLLTLPNAPQDADEALIAKLGLKKRQSYVSQ